VPLIVLLALGCSGAPEDHLQWRESWELIALLEGSRALDASVTIGNTGMLRGQGRLRLDLWDLVAAPIHFSRHAGPLAVQQDTPAGRAVIGIDGLAREGTGWSLRVADDHVNALIQLRPQASATPSHRWERGPWTVEAPVVMGDISGWITAGERGGLVSGRGLLLHRQGHAVPALPRLGAYILTDSFQLIVDQHGEEALTWAALDGEPLSTANITTDFPEDGPITITLPEAGSTVTIRRRRTGGTIDPYDHLLAAEAWLAAPLTGRPARRVQTAQATVTIGERTIRAPAVLIELRPQDMLSAP
jgi:hypothetical protein